MTINLEARTTGQGYCHGYKQPDEHYHDSYEELEVCAENPYWLHGERYDYQRYVELRPHALDGKARATTQRWLAARGQGAVTLKGGK